MVNKPGVAGDAAHPARRRIVHRAAQQLMSGPAQGQPYGVHFSVGAIRGGPRSAA